MLIIFATLLDVFSLKQGRYIVEQNSQSLRVFYYALIKGDVIKVGSTFRCDEIHHYVVMYM